MSNEDEYLALILIELRETRRLQEQLILLLQPGVKPASPAPSKKPVRKKA